MPVLPRSDTPPSPGTPQTRSSGCHASCTAPKLPPHPRSGCQRSRALLRSTSSFLTPFVPDLVYDITSVLDTHRLDQLDKPLILLRGHFSSFSRRNSRQAVNAAIAASQLATVSFSSVKLPSASYRSSKLHSPTRYNS